jgi:hypothetical protein
VAQAEQIQRVRLAQVKVTMYDEVAPLRGGLRDIARQRARSHWLHPFEPPPGLSVSEVAYQLEALNNLLFFCDTTGFALYGFVDETGRHLTARRLTSPGWLDDQRRESRDWVLRLTLSSPLVAYIATFDATVAALILLMNRVNAARRKWADTDLAVHRAELQRDIVTVTRDMLRETGPEMFETPEGDRLVHLALTGIANVENAERVTDDEPRDTAG